MKPVHTFFLIVAAALLLQSCTDSTPFYTSAETVLKQKQIMEKKFDKNAQYGSVVLMFDKSTGNFITAQVKSERLTNWWTYMDMPMSRGRRGMNLNITSLFGGTWTQSREELIEPGKQTFFGINELCWDKIPGLFSAVYQDMQKKGVSEPELKTIMFSNYYNQLTGTITATTRGGGTSVNYEFNMNGKLVREPKF